MPHFDANGYDTYICQKCATTRSLADSRPEWRKDITGSDRAGNVCEECVAKYEAGRVINAYVDRYFGMGEMMGLREHCYIESGGLTGRALDNYISRIHGLD
jgi:hypothetical protein